MNIPAPDYISPIVGYRLWSWTDTGLWSPNGEAWRPSSALIAKCPKANHEAPDDGCSCGIYASKNYQQLRNFMDFNVEYCLHGEVYLWGKVVEHAFGYRAQFAYPKSLVLPLNFDPYMEPSLLEPLIVYGADISLPSNILLWTKNSGYTPAGLDWLVETGKPCGKWCEQWHERTLQLGDCVTVLGRGIGWVEPDDGSSGCNSGSVCIRLKNNDLFIVPHRGILWNCQNWRWEVNLSEYMGTVLLPSSKGSWKILFQRSYSSPAHSLLP